MRDPPAWHQDEAFWEAVREFVFPPEKIDEASKQVEQLCSLLDLDAGMRVLDVPCGIGRHAVELAQRGIDVTAVDATATYLETAKSRAGDAGVDIEFVRGDMREFRRPESFDAVLNLYTSFGYFDDRADDERAARNFYESLKPGRPLLMHLTGKEILAREFRARTWVEQDGAYFIEEHEITDDWNRIENRWILVDDGNVEEFDVSHRLYSAYELSDLLEGVGFSDVSVYGDLAQAAYDHTADALVVVARR